MANYNGYAVEWCDVGKLMGIFVECAAAYFNIKNVCTYIYHSNSL